MREVYSGFVEENFDAYLDRIQLNGEVGDHPEIQAMAELYNRPILVYAADSGAVTEFRCGVDQANNEARKDDDSPPIRVLYVNGNHYNSIVDVTRPSVGVGLGLAGLVAPAVSLEEQTVARAKEASELEETEKKLVAAVIMEHGDAEAERELMEQALREDARQRAEDEARLFAEAMKASTNVPDDDALLVSSFPLLVFGLLLIIGSQAAALEASENEMMQRIMMESMYNQRGGGGNSNN